MTLTAAGLLSGTPGAGTAGTYPLVITAQGFSQVVTQNFTLTVIPLRIPNVISPSFSDVKSTSATLGGDVASDNGLAILKRGVLFAPSSVNSNPALGGNGVTEVDDGNPTVGNFADIVTGLSPQTTYSFVAFATNSRGTGYSSVATFKPSRRPAVARSSSPRSTMKTTAPAIRMLAPGPACAKR